MKSSCVSRNIYSHIARGQRGPCGPWLAAAGQGLAAWPDPCPGQDLGPGGGASGAAPAPDTGHGDGDRDKPRPGWDMSPWVGLAKQRPMAWQGPGGGEPRGGWNGALGCRRRGEGSRGWAGAGRAISASWPWHERAATASFVNDWKSISPAAWKSNPTIYNCRKVALKVAVDKYILPGNCYG